MKNKKRWTLEEGLRRNRDQGRCSSFSRCKRSRNGRRTAGRTAINKSTRHTFFSNISLDIARTQTPRSRPTHEPLSFLPLIFPVASSFFCIVCYYGNRIFGGFVTPTAIPEQSGMLTIVKAVIELHTLTGWRPTSSSGSSLFRKITKGALWRWTGLYLK